MTTANFELAEVGHRDDGSRNKGVFKDRGTDGGKMRRQKRKQPRGQIVGRLGQRILVVDDVITAGT